MPRLFLQAAIELLAWLLPACAFLWLYVTQYQGAPTGVAPHLGLVATLMAVTLGVRWLLFVLGRPKLALFIGSMLSATSLGLLCLYYVLALVGFGAWGYLVSWGLISAYLGQAAHLAEALGPSAYALAAAAALVFLLALVATYFLLARFDWLATMAKRSSASMSAVVVAGLLLIPGVVLWHFSEFPPTGAGEPFALSIYPASFDRKFQSHARSGSRMLEAEEKAARAAYGPAAAPPVTNVILIVVDALRARNMGVYGYARQTTPFLDQLARQGSLQAVRRAQSVCAESSCGLMGIASSRYVHRFVDQPLTLSEVLRLNGYRIHMLLSGDHTNFYGLRAMYGRVDTYMDGSMSTDHYINNDAAVVEALRRLQLRQPTGNFFQFHLMSNHVLGTRSAQDDRFGEMKSYYAATGGMGVREASDADLRRFTNFYDAGVVRADETIRQLFNVLAQKGLLDDALVVITADHGEYVGERGLYGHAKGVWGEVLDVPLLLMASGTAGTLDLQTGLLASQVDIAPTLLAHLGVPAPSTWMGVPLQKGKAAAGKREVYFQQQSAFGLVAQAADGRVWKYWVDARSGKEHAYALNEDPLETVNRIGEIPRSAAARWRAALLSAEVNVRESLTFR